MCCFKSNYEIPQLSCIGRKNMGMIEEYWDDITVYCVEFITGNGEKKVKRFNRTFVFNSTVSEEEVYGLVKSRLKNIVEVTAVDELYDGLMLKEKKIANH